MLLRSCRISASWRFERPPTCSVPSKSQLTGRWIHWILITAMALVILVILKYLSLKLSGVFQKDANWYKIELIWVNEYAWSPQDSRTCCNMLKRKTVKWWCIKSLQRFIYCWYVVDILLLLLYIYIYIYTYILYSKFSKCWHDTILSWKSIQVWDLRCASSAALARASPRRVMACTKEKCGTVLRVLCVSPKTTRMCGIYTEWPSIMYM